MMLHIESLLLLAGSAEEFGVGGLLQRSHSEGEPGPDISSVRQEVRLVPSGRR